MEDEKIIALMEGYAAGTLTEEDAAAFFQWYSQAGLEEFHSVYARCNLPPGSLWGSPDIPEDFRTRLAQAVRDHEVNEPIPMFRRYRWSWAAAILLLSVGGYLFYHHTSADKTGIADHRVSSNDVAPGTTRALLTLSDGRQVTIDGDRSGQLAIQGRTTVQNDHGAITYDGHKKEEIQNGHKKEEIQKSVKVLFNTLATNRGEQSPPLTLSDGTKVWLNALSSIRFPVAFTGSSRDVEITGEAFFEVTRNPSMPFHVKTMNMEVEVLGTQFNINAYSDEPDTRTTLLEGSVKIASDPTHSLILEPGQQARVLGGPGQQAPVLGGPGQQTRVPGEVSLVKDPDIDQATAWKKGLFDFSHADLQTVLKQLARWYDIEVKFEGKIPVRSFHGKITRDLNLSQVIQLLQDVNVKFRISGKTLIVTP